MHANGITIAALALIVIVISEVLLVLIREDQRAVMPVPGRVKRRREP